MLYTIGGDGKPVFFCLPPSFFPGMVVSRVCVWLLAFVAGGPPDHPGFWRSLIMFSLLIAAIFQAVCLSSFLAFVASPPFRLGFTASSLTRVALFAPSYERSHLHRPPISGDASAFLTRPPPGYFCLGADLRREPFF